MGSNTVAPIQDPNLYLSLPTTSTATVIPKVEPKIEPFDGPPLPPPPLHVLTTPSPAPFPSPSSTGAEADVYSEYDRISDLFRTAFAQRLEKYNDASILPESEENSLAIVPVENPDAQLSNVDLTPRGRARKFPPRSSELVRVMDIKPEDRSYYRDVIRKTRMLYDSLRVFIVAEDEKNRDVMVPHRKARGDLKAAALLRDSGMWLNRDKRIVGDLPGVSIGDVFFFRMELCVVGLHGQVQAGIDYVPASRSSNGEPIATSVIVSGGYEDDEDSGDVIVYSGHGGQDKHKQVGHQRLEYGNLALERSMHYGLEVRVIRGFKYEGGATDKVYVYDGLYRIMETWFDVGKSGFGVFKYKLVRIENQVEMGSAIMKLAKSLRKNPLDARPNGYVTLDLSMKKENFPVFFFNDIDGDHDPIYYEYLKATIFPSFVYNGGSQTGCQCFGGCSDNCFCAMKNGGEYAYDRNGILVRGKPLIFECGPHCRCPPTCRNRVSQRGIKNRFEVFRSRETGWGVRSLDLIQAGSFICEYAGVVLTRDQVQIFTMNGDSLIYPSRFGDRWAEWGDLSQIFSDYVRPAYPSIPPLDFAIDVSRMRNVACYMCHSSSPNAMVQLVLYDHNNLSFPHLMVFAMENIPPMREISLDYGVADDLTAKLAICN